MNVLSLELSTARPSVALFTGGKLVTEAVWEEGKERKQQVFDVLRDLFAKQGDSPREIDLFAVGRGPGNFSGLRTAITAAHGLAIPHGKSVVAVSSGEAMARAIRADHADPVIVLGDARRDTVWYSIFDRETDAPAVWHLTAPQDSPKRWPEKAVLVSSDWGRLEKILPAGPSWQRVTGHPLASQVGALAQHRKTHGVLLDPVEPIYMHPPV